MTNKEYINQHPEQFKDDIDKWLFTEFGIIGGCCSAEKSHEYSVARMVAEKLTDAFIEKACNFIDERLNFDDNAWYIEGEVTVKDKVIEDFKNYIKGE